MVTGDNLHTASHIASECGILQPGGLVLEGPDFRKLPEAELLQLLPRLQVTTSSPSWTLSWTSAARSQAGSCLWPADV